MSRIVWRQFGTALFGILAFYLLLLFRSHQASNRWADLHGGIIPLLLIEFPRWVADALPLAAGVAMALLPLRAGAFPVALRMLVVIYAALIVYDVSGKPYVNVASITAYTSPPGERGITPRLDDTAGVLQRAIAHARGIVRPEDITRWPPPATSSAGFAPITDGSKIVRRDLTEVVWGFVEFGFPFLLMGWVLGFGAWLRRIATFRLDRDERLLRLVTGWGIVIGLLLLLAMLYRDFSFDVSMRDGWMGWLVVPSLLAAVPAFLGWRAVWRLDRLAGE